MADPPVTAPYAPLARHLHVVDVTSPADPAQRVLLVIVDGRPLVADCMSAALSEAPDLSVAAVATSRAEGLTCMRRLQPDVCLLQERLPDGAVTDLLPALAEASPGTRVLLLTDGAESATDRDAGDCLAGFVTESQHLSALLHAVRAAAAGESVPSAPTPLRTLPPARVGGSRGQGEQLTRRERQVLGLLADGRSTRAIAEELVISTATARNHIQAVLSKLGAHSKLEAVSIALRASLVARP